MNTTFKRLCTLGLASALVLGTLAGCGGSSSSGSSASGGDASGGSISIKLASMNGEEHASARAWKYIADELESRTDGGIQCEIYWNGALGADMDNIEQVQNGAPMIACAGSPLLGDLVPDISIVGAPYIYEDDYDYEKLNESDWWGTMQTALSEQGMHIYDLMYCGPRVVCSNKEIHTPDDMQGMKLRAPSSPMYWEICQAMTGGSATTLSFSEQYNGLQQKVIDACEPSYPDLYDCKLYEVTTNVAETNHMILTSVYYTSEELYNSLSDEYKTIFDEVLTEAGIIYSDDNKALNDEVRDLLINEYGIQIDEVDIDAFKEATEVVYTKFPEWSEGLRETVRAAMGYDA